MVYQLSPRVVLISCAFLATAGCATYGGQQRRDVYLEVPCGAPGAFRAELPPAKRAMAPEPAGAAAAAPQPQSPQAQASSTHDAEPGDDAAPHYEAGPGRESICLARADYLPRGYRGSAYRYYDNYWWPYRGYAYGYGFGIGIGGGHHGGGHHGGGHHGGGHHGGHR